jgi:hypothetical protein
LFRALLEKASEDTNKRANAARDKSDRIDLRVRKGLQPEGNAKKKKSKKSKGIAKSKPLQSVKPLKPTAANTSQQATSNSVVGDQSFTSKDISDIRNDYIQSSLNYSP